MRRFRVDHAPNVEDAGETGHPDDAGRDVHPHLGEDGAKRMEFVLLVFFIGIQLASGGDELLAGATQHGAVVFAAPGIRLQSDPPASGVDLLQWYFEKRR